MYSWADLDLDEFQPNIHSQKSWLHYEEEVLIKIKVSSSTYFLSI